uniref:carbonyl reductase (NADPH) n=1 Tax=Salarias fasciatus TaxID=181472 RepID=A0A672GTI0_SALFA
MTKCNTTVYMSVRVAVVTGSNDGIGLAIVRALCSQFEGDVYLTARNVGRGQKAVESLISEGLKPKFLQLDINDLNSITAAAAFFKESYGGVDVLVNNAAIAFKGKASQTIHVSVQRRTSLTQLCVSGRVVNVSSFAALYTLRQCSPALQQRFRSTDITEDELVGLMQQFVDETKTNKHQQAGWPQTAYGVSKIGLTTLSMILARRLSKERPNDGILLNSCCPGWVRTNMAGPKAPKSPEEGADTPVYLALLPPGATEPHGKFISARKVREW